MKNRIKIYKKRGFSVVITPIIVLICMIFILFLTCFIVNVIKPFILYEKLNGIANKYMFVIEKYGYLSQNEKMSLEEEIKNRGFDLENIDIVYPEFQKSYGEVLEFCIKYQFDLKVPLLNDKGVEKTSKKINLTVKKHSISKI